MDKKRFGAILVILPVLTIALAWCGIVLGSRSVPADEIIPILCGKGSDAVRTNIILNIRLPRVLAAILLGGALALSGYILQTFFANPIVGPFVLGISSGAKLAVALAMIFVLSAGHSFGLNLMVLSAFAGAMAAMLFVLAVSVKVRSMSILVVCGIMIGYICSAITDLVVTFADDSDIVNLHNWSLGSLSGVNTEEIRILFGIVLICFVIAMLLGKPMNAYRLGEAYARSVGVHIRGLRVMLILVSSLLAAGVTAFAGPISFVGIAVPHLIRSSLKSDEAHVMIPACFLGGSVVTLLCDTIARTVFAPTEVSISSVTAVFLVPVVIFMMISRNRTMNKG